MWWTKQGKDSPEKMKQEIHRLKWFMFKGVEYISRLYYRAINIYITYNKAIKITHKEDITPFVESPFHVLSCVVKIRHWFL